MVRLINVFNHLVLPLKLPNAQDDDVENTSNEITSRLIHATSTMSTLAGPDQASTWLMVRRLLRRCHSIHAQGRLEKKLLVSEFQSIQHNQPILLHVLEQNAALILRRNISANADVVTFEAFETSPPSAEVLASDGAFVWDFPDRVTQIPFTEFQKPSLQEALADFLEKSSMEPLRCFQAHITKAQTSVVESRDTASPALLTDVLISLLESIGSSAGANFIRLRKRVRDDATIKDAELPWRRLPFWLVLRVGVQRQLQLSLGNDAGKACYKFLVTTLLIELLNECPGQLSPEFTLMLRAKVCRRLAKLEQEKCNSPGIYGHLFTTTGPFFKESIMRVTDSVNVAWEKFKRDTSRRIPPLPIRADQDAQHLVLANSNSYLANVLTLSRKRKKPDLSLRLPTSRDKTIERVEQFTHRYSQLAELESRILRKEEPQLTEIPEAHLRCEKFANTILNLFETVGTAYESDPEQISVFILCLFTLWVRLDKYMVAVCPLLLKYHPVFTPELLNALHLPTISGMKRLHNIQSYLKERCNASEHQTNIFSEPDEHCFVVKYVAQSDQMKKLLQRIQDASSASRQAKENELKRWSEEYDSHSSSISGGTCTCKFERDGSRNVRGCTKCWHWRVRNRMTITAHEDFLPKNEAKAATVVFELGVSGSLAAYRNATWKIFKLAHPAEPSSPSPVKLLKGYEPLTRYYQSSSTGITIASMSKSFRGTHYKVAKKKMKANVSDVLYPNGLTFCYFDSASNGWIKNFDKPLTFEHLCGVHIPSGLRESVMPALIHPPTELCGPSSYEIVASETRCPPSMSIQEFTAYQRLLSGKARRWLTMLVELGASDVNFSSESTMRIFNHLATQAGPAQLEISPYRDIHVVFKDITFCDRLATQVRNRLSNITSNWREVHCMEILITLALRLLTMASSKVLATGLLIQAREITLKWIMRLRADVRSAMQTSVAEIAAKYAFWAALLCRRTFFGLAELDHTMTQDDLSTFVQASLALQENLLVDLTKLSPTLKRMLIRDTKMVCSFQTLIYRSIKAFPKSVGDAINSSWSDPGNTTRKVFTEWHQASSSQNRWIVSVVTSSASSSANPQVVHYNYIEGHLLVDGKPLGRLPLEIRESDEVKQLFGTQHLLTFPSAESGMSYVLATRINNHEVHFGIRNGRVVIRTCNREGLLEYIHHAHFAGPGAIDLPSSLMSNCTHWLNLNTKCIEVRRKPALWRTRPSDWIINLKTRRGIRSNRTCLIDPTSNLFKQVADIFRHFEDPHKITIFQPISSQGKLSVELRHLELSFFVNSKGLLQCRELKEEISPDQDAGTLYGFDSKIVLRDVVNPTRRSIIAPWGQVSTQRLGMHVIVGAASSNEYARFEIDDVLGRITCAFEPRLLYAKALFHALTSFAIPDRLTGRSGTEEAFHMLNSGCCQPWAPLGPLPINILRTIEKISPGREYYPRNSKVLQNVLWDDNLTMTIQHDGYEGLVQKILNESERLRVFAPNNKEDVHLSTYKPKQLRKRSITQRALYDRSFLDKNTVTDCDRLYKSRGQRTNSMQATKVSHIGRLLQARPFRIHTDRKLSAILEDWPLIGGFCNYSRVFPASLSDLTEKSIAEQWGSLVNTCRYSASDDSYSLMFRLSLMSINSKTDMDAIQILVAFASSPALRNLQPPSHPSFNQFSLNEVPTLQSICRVISVDMLEKPKRKMDKAEKVHWKMQEDEKARLAQHLLDQWPNEEISSTGFESNTIDVELAMERIIPEWHRLHANLSLSEYVTRAQSILERYNEPMEMPAQEVQFQIQESPRTPARRSVVPSVSEDLVTKALAIPVDLSAESGSPHAGIKDLKPSSKIQPYRKLPSKETAELRKILTSFTSSPNALRKQYGDDLAASLDALEMTSSDIDHFHSTPKVTAIEENIHHLRERVTSQLLQIRNAFAVNDDRFQWLELGCLWPCNTTTEMLEQLSSSSMICLGGTVKELLVSHGVLITSLQRLLRIQGALYHRKDTQLQEELANVGHRNWSPFDFPDWLLLEIDSNILIREEQIDVANAIITPKSQSNTVLQLNMGKGKTSCIVPMAMAVIGNGEQLSRLIVPKQLLLPTAQMIQSRLGGLVGREVRHLPFSRRTKVNPETLELHRHLHQEMCHRHGVILNAPEHILSYKLRGLQYVASSDLDVASEMVHFQSWLDSTCRDVLDESDVSLAVKTQLIFPSGEQNMVDGHPHRWQVAQSLLSLVKDHLPGLRQKYPRSIEIVERGNGYPMVYILQSDVEDDLHGRIIDEISTGRTEFLRSMISLSSSNHEDIRKILSQNQLDRNLLERVATLFDDKAVASNILLLVRGLLRNRILLLCLKKRWSVQYGLHPGRDPIAVPFEAKGVPSEQAEFGHPDAAILFTCLAFYYSGLNPAQFRDALRQVITSHDPASEYDRWTSSCITLPEALRHWNVINVDDQDQVEELWKNLRTSQSVLNHYMNRFVFPAHAKQFSIKLQASGWDLPLFPKMESADRARTTGFSGTNDNRMMLPLTIQQGDLPSLHQTNAEVLTYLLQQRNRTYHIAAQGDKRLSEKGFLEQLKAKNIRILIDAGAYILEMGNEALVTAWLDIDTEPPAAVFFGADNRAWVRYRGMKAAVPLLATPFAGDLENCLVYLDEAHTRGVDLQLPRGACGALTLAIGQTKDHTVQAAMRLRQLATTQTVCFFAFPETHQSILDVCKANDQVRIDSHHVVYWLLEQTCLANEQLQNLYISQGTDFCNRFIAQSENANFLSDSQHRDAYVKVLQHSEQQTLEQLYGGLADDTQRPAPHTTTFPQIKTVVEKLDVMRRAVASNASVLNSSVFEEVEQEREVEYQVEEVRQVQRPVHYNALVFPGLHPAISEFAHTGVLLGEAGYEHVYTAVSRTSIGQKFGIRSTQSRCFVSGEFMKTIVTRSTLVDNFLRPIEWILYCPATSTALIIIAEEAEILIPALRAQTTPAKVHLLTYSAPVTKKMLHFGGLRYFALPALPPEHAVPHSLATDLGNFAGRLYMDFDEYSLLVNYTKNRNCSSELNAPTTSLVGFLIEWLSLRRKGQDILHTPIGYVCQGRPLNSEHTFFSLQCVADKSVVRSCRRNGAVDRMEKDDDVDEEYSWDDADGSESV